MESKIKGLVKGLVEEIIKADMTMHQSQVEAWNWMAQHPPKGSYIPDDIMRGFPENRYLSMKEVELKLFLKPVPVMSAWQRVKNWFGISPPPTRFRPGKPFNFEFSNAGDKEAQALTITIKRLENGTIKANYAPADALTAEFMRE